MNQTIRDTVEQAFDVVLDKLSVMPFDQRQQFDLFLEQYAAFIRAQAIEQAAIKVDQWNVYGSEEYDRLAHTIRALK